MNCEAVVNVEDLYTEGRLSPARTAQVRAHLKDCALCGSRLKSGLLSLKSPPAEAPKDLKDRMKSLLSRTEALPARRAPAPLFDSEAWPIAATVAVWLALAVFLSSTGPGVPSQKYGQPAQEATR